jgi:class 3 adenylate cyclase
MADAEKAELRRLRLLEVIVSLWINFAGATLTFVYFNFIETGLRAMQARVGAGGQTILFFLIAGALLTIITVLALRSGRSTAWLWEIDGEESDPEKLESLRVYLMNMPFRAAIRGLRGWTAAGIIFAILQFFVQEASTRSVYPSIRVFVGIVFIGAPFTIISVYFALEWWIRRKIPGLFPKQALVNLPKATRINILPKMLVVSFLIGIVPVSMVSHITLSQIHEIQAGRLAVSDFLSAMPLVIGFLLVLSVLVAVRLSTFVAQSVSEPLRQVSSAMERISKGELDLSVAVVSNDEIGSLADGFNKMARGLRERDFIRNTLGSYVSPEVAAEILKSPDSLNIGGESREVTILIADLREFTPLAASASAEVVVKLLNRYFERMIDIIMMYGGTVDELMGDGILAFFGAPKRIPDAPLRAVQCAIEMQSVMPPLNAELKKWTPELYFPGADSGPTTEGNPTGFLHSLSMGIAINSGSLIVGNLGSDKRKKYGAVGSAINVAFRIEKQAKADEILMTSAVYSKVAKSVEAAAMDEVELKGIDTPVSLYRVIGLRRATGADL